MKGCRGHDISSVTYEIHRKHEAGEALTKKVGGDEPAWCKSMDTVRAAGRGQTVAAESREGLCLFIY